jgi:hypothetical protein
MSECSRRLPDPVRIWTRKGKTDKLRFVIYPELSYYRRACKKCKYIAKADGRRVCSIGDPDFDLKFYGWRKSARGVQVWVGTVPPALVTRKPLLCAEVASYLKRRVRSFQARGISDVVARQREQSPGWQPEETAGVVGSGVKPNRSGGVVSR